jgi:hypothetical protein
MTATPEVKLLAMNDIVCDSHLVKNEAVIEDHKALNKRISNPSPKHEVAKAVIFHSLAVQVRLSHIGMFSILQVKNSVPHDRQCCKREIVKLVDPRLVEGLPREHIVEAEVKLHDYVKHIFVKIPAHQISVAPVTLTTVHEQQWYQESKLPDSVVRASRRLHAFLPSDSHSNISLHYHRHIVSTIPDRKRRFAWIAVFYHLHYVSLLLRRHSAGKNNANSVRNFKEPFT